MTVTRGAWTVVVAVAVLCLTAGAASAGAPQGGALPPSFCSRVVTGGAGTPDFIIASDEALQLGREPAGMVAAIRWVLARHGYRAGRFSVGYQSCDDSTPQNPNGDLSKCASNAKAYAADAKVIAVIGTWFSGCSGAELPTFGRSPSGPLVLVSPNNTSPGLTHRTRGSQPGDPQTYYPTGTRNYVRLEAPDDFQGIAAARLAKQLRLHRLFVLDDAESYGLDVAGGFMGAAHVLGLAIAGSGGWNPATSDFRKLAARVARSHPDGVFLAGAACARCAGLLRELRKALPTATVILPEAFGPASDLVKLAGAAANRSYLINPGLAPSRYGTLGKALQRKFGSARDDAGGAPAAAQAAEIVLASIARSNGSRASVAAQVRRNRVTNGILGTFHFDANGDMSSAPLTVYRIVRGHAGPDRVLRVSSALLHPRAAGP
jgi:branched-chain amino acid transport system substrate-binding protein